MKRQLIIGVMGGGTAESVDIDNAYRLGILIAENNWILLNGGRNAGIMEASAKGANENGGVTIGILPDDNYTKMSDYIQIPILTGLGNARNSINALSSNVVVACPGGAGTISEIALALKTGRNVICMNFDIGNIFCKYEELIHYANTPEKVIGIIKTLKPFSSCSL